MLFRLQAVEAELQQKAAASPAGEMAERQREAGAQLGPPADGLSLRR